MTFQCVSYLLINPLDVVHCTMTLQIVASDSYTSAVISRYDGGSNSARLKLPLVTLMYRFNKACPAIHPARSIQPTNQTTQTNEPLLYSLIARACSTEYAKCMAYIK